MAREITISVDEFLRLKELEKHAKKVEIIEKFEYEKDGKYNHTGSSIAWESDGKCWFRLSNKLSRQNDILDEKRKEIKRLEGRIKELEFMDVKDFKRLSKAKRKGNA